MRLGRAEMLVDAIARAHPDDARAVMTAALVDLSRGTPDAAIFGTIREDAQWWARFASEAEVFEVTRACLEELPSRALHLDHRKKLMAALWRSMPTAAQRAFLDWTGAAHVD